MGATTRQLYIGLVSEPGDEAKARYLRYLSGERKGQIKTFTYREAVAIEAGRSYNDLTPQAVVVVLPIGLPGQPTLEELTDA